MLAAYFSFHRAVLFAIVASITLYCANSIRAAQAPRPDMPASITAKCTHVVDGDSLYLAGFKPQVRLWGVDAPEREQRGYDEARNTLTQLAKGRRLHCELKDIDKYARYVARCFVQMDSALSHAIKNGRESTVVNTNASSEVNRELLRRGVAKEYCWFSKGHYGYCN